MVAYLAGYRETDKGASFYSSLLGASSTNESAIRLATKAIREEGVEISDCIQILAALGDTYSDLTDSSKNPKFEATQCNKDLLEGQ